MTKYELVEKTGFFEKGRVFDSEVFEDSVWIAYYLQAYEVPVVKVVEEAEKPTVVPVKVTKKK